MLFFLFLNFYGGLPSKCKGEEVQDELVLIGIGYKFIRSCLLTWIVFKNLFTPLILILFYLFIYFYFLYFLYCRNGGMCMHDEAATHYIDMIDQTTLGHRFIKEEFGIVPRIGWQIDPFGHSAVQAYLLGAEVSLSLYLALKLLLTYSLSCSKHIKCIKSKPIKSQMIERTSICTSLTNIGQFLLFVQLGFDSLFFGRIDYQDRAKRINEKSLEFVWQGSKSLGSSAQVKSEFFFFFFVGRGAGLVSQYLLILVSFLCFLCIVSDFL